MASEGLGVRLSSKALASASDGACEHVTMLFRVRLSMLSVAMAAGKAVSLQYGHST